VRVATSDSQLNDRSPRSWAPLVRSASASPSDATVPLAAAVSGDATRMLGVWQGSADSRADKREAASLIERIGGLRCVDCGRLEMARIGVGGSPTRGIAVKIRHTTHAGIRLTGLPETLWSR